MGRHEESIASMLPVSERLYGSIDLNRLAVYAIDLLNKAQIPTTLEHLSVCLFRLFPVKFSLKGYPHPDSCKVNRALLQLRPKYRNWAVGTVYRGFELTELGRIELEQVTNLLTGPNDALGIEQPRRKARTPIVGEEDLRHIRTSELFALYATGRGTEAELRLVYEVLQVFPYTPKKMVIKRRESLRDLADRACDAEVVSFLDWVRSKHRRAFEDTRERG